jgi:O-antigen/teichoic acid export membrane protein
LGVGNAAIYYINKREVTIRNVLAAAHIVTGFATAATALLVAAVVPWFDDNALGVGVSPWMLVPAVPALLYWNLMRFVLQAESRFVDLGVATVSQQALLIAAIVALIVFGEPTPARAAWCLIGATAASGAFSLTRVGLRHVDLGLVFRPRLATLRKLAGFGVQGEIGNVLQMLNYRLDQYLVRYFVGLAGVGIYAVGASMTEAIFVLANAVALVLLPRLTANEEEAHWMAPLATRNTMLIAAVAAIGLAAVAPVLVPLAFGEEYQDSVQALWLLLPGTVALAGSKVLTSYIFSKGRPLVNTAITALSLVVTIGADLILIPVFDVNGAAIASSLAYFAHFAAALLAYSMISGRSPLGALIPGREDAKLYRDAWTTFTAKLRRASAQPGSPRP